MSHLCSEKFADIMRFVTPTEEGEIMVESTGLRYPSISNKIIAIVGGFGSGKTEVSVNLAKFFVTTEKSPVTLADLDLVNPYFRSREAIKEMEKLGVRVIAPKGGHSYADLPILMPEVRGAIGNPGGRLILDVGGDAQGTRAMGSMSNEFVPGEYDMLMVLNTRRPQTADVDTTLRTMERIEATAKVKFTGLVSNSHMIDETDAEVVLEGYNLACEIHERSGLDIAFISAKTNVLKSMDLSKIDCAVLPLTRSMLKPWERKEELEKK